MISWRYHVISIVAVVLAFGLGVLAGTAVVNDEFVSQLRANTRRAQEQRDAAQAQAAQLDAFAEDLQPVLRDGILAGRSATVLTMEGVDEPARRTVSELTAAGVEVLATFDVTRRLADPDPDDVVALQKILSVSSNEPATLRDRAAEALAVRLAVGSDGGDDDVLAAMLDEGLVTTDRDLDRAALQAIGGVGQPLVLAAGGTPPQGLPDPSAMLLPITERLVSLQADVAVVGPSDDAYGLVAQVRDAGGIPDCSLVTIDDIDLTIGGIALAMGIDRLLDDPDPAFRSGGDYGVSADRAVPGGEPPASCRI